MPTTPPHAATGASAVSPAQTRRVARATMLGSAIEWYDFNVYGAASALIFAPQFFPTFSPVAATLAAFGTFAVGFIARPIGGVVFGHFGDRLGRKQTLIASLLLMGVGTFMISLLPTFSSIGLAAPVLLVVLRFVQGLGVGGEWGGAVLMAMEHAPPGRRGWFSSFPQMGLPGGSVAALVVFLVASVSMDRADFTGWGWRIPFLLSALLVVVALVIRLRIQESPEFTAARRAGSVRRLPVLEVLRTSPRMVVLGMGITLAPSAFGYLLSVYLLSYGTGTVKVPQQTMLLTIIAGSVLYLVVCIVSGRLSDRVGAVRIFLVGSALGVVVPFAVFGLIDTGATALIVVGTMLMGLVLGGLAATQAVIISRAFATAVRYSGASLSYQFGAVLGGGLTPLLAASILAAAGTSQAIAAYIGVLSLLSGLAVWRLAATSPAEGDEAPPDPENPAARPVDGGGAVRA